MPNLFDRPIAAKPMSEFVALPLDFIDRSLQRKQAAYDSSRAQMDAMEDGLLKVSALSKDKEKLTELLQGYDQDLDSIVKSVDGDYGRAGGFMRELKRKIDRDMQYGEVGAINKNFQLAGAAKSNYDKLYQDNKISAAGHTLGMQSIGDWQTTLGDNGSYSSFQGYTPSNIVDPRSQIIKSVKDIHGKFDDSGQEFVSSDDIETNLSSQLSSRPELIRAMQENFRANYIGDNPSEDFKKYYDATLQSIISDRQYQKKLTANKKGSGSGKASDTIRGREWGTVVIPSKGSSSYKGGSSSYLKAGAKWALGMDTDKELNDYIASEEGKFEIDYMEKITGTTLPKSYLDRVEWIENNIDKPQSAKLISETVPSTMMDGAIKNGNLLTRGAISDMSGNYLDDDQIKSIQGQLDNGSETYIVGMVGENSGYPYGSFIIESHDGNTYIQENLDTEILGSPKFAKSLINSAKHTNTGHKELKFDRPVVQPNTGKTLIPMGSYDARHNYNRDAVTLFQNGKPMYAMVRNAKTGQQEIINLTKEE